MDESKAFINKAENKLISSKILYDVGQYGDSVGRSYYAMFLSAKALLVKDGYDVNSHKSLISIFGNIIKRIIKLYYLIYVLIKNLIRVCPKTPFST